MPYMIVSTVRGEADRAARTYKQTKILPTEIGARQEMVLQFAMARRDHPGASNPVLHEWDCSFVDGGLTYNWAIVGFIADRGLPGRPVKA